MLRAGYVFEGPTREVFEEIRPDLQPGMGIRIDQLAKKRL